MRTRIKICGITRIEDAQAAAQAGVDAIGLVFVPQSPRFVTVEQAAKIARAVPAFVNVVGLFVNESSEKIRAVLGAVVLDLLQFHGSETPAQCREFNRPYLKAFSMKPDVNIVSEAVRYEDARAVLLDTYHPVVAGGTGDSFDWSHVPKNIPKPVILAGGLNPQNVASAIAMVRPYAVDVSSGVESAKGIKDAGKIRAFVRAVHEAA